jgi:hypothetical protein
MVMMELDGISFGANNSVQEMDAGVNIVQALWVDGPESNVVDVGALLHSYSSFSALHYPHANEGYRICSAAR